MTVKSFGHKSWTLAKQSLVSCSAVHGCNPTPPSLCRQGMAHTQQTEETRIFQKKEGRWLNVHCHRSQAACTSNPFAAKNC